jgi:hypothetical protein
MRETCRKCRKTHKPGKLYTFYYGQLVNSYSYDTTRYSGSKMITTTHSGASYDMRGDKQEYLCNGCVIKSTLGEELILLGVGIFLFALVGFALQFVFYSRVPYIIGLSLAGILLITAVVSVLLRMQAANSDDPAKQEKYLKDLAESEAGSKLAIRLNRKEVKYTVYYDEKTVFFTPSEYYKLNRRY